MLLVLRCHYPAELVSVTSQNSDERHNLAIIRPAVQHPRNNKGNILCLIGVVKRLRCKIGSQCCKVLHSDTGELKGFEWIFSAVCMQGSSPALQTDQGRKAELKVGTLRHGEGRRTHQKRRWVISEASRRLLFKTVKLLNEVTLINQSLLSTPVWSRSSSRLFF